jgi:hypothetical protein
MPVGPGASIFDLHAVPLGAPGPPPNPLTRLKQQDRAPTQRGFPRGGDTGESGADDDHVVHAGCLPRAGRRRLGGRDAPAHARVDGDGPGGRDEHGIELDQVQRVRHQQLTRALGQPGRGADVDRTGAARRRLGSPGSSRAAAAQRSPVRNPAAAGTPACAKRHAERSSSSSGSGQD